MKKNILEKVTDKVITRLHQIAESKDVMKIYYANESNGNEPQPLNEVYVDRILNKHGKEGMVMISANRTGLDKETNNKNTKSLIADIQRFGRSYLPVYGGYHGKDDIVDYYEPSFIVTNYSVGGKLMDFERLKQFAIDMCAKYDQDSVLIKAPNDVPHFYDRNGNITSQNDTDKVIKNDPNQEFFTSLIKTQKIDTQNPDRLKRFTYIMNQDNENVNQEKAYECYINPSPVTINERRNRSARGEIIFGFCDKGRLMIC